MLTLEDIAGMLIISNDQSSYISRYKMRKKSKTGTIKFREIVAPNEEYKVLQEKMVAALSNLINRVSEVSYAWVKGRNRHNCAANHVGQKCVLELDIEDYFNNITDSHLRNLFLEEGINDVYGLMTEDVIRFCTIDNPKLNRRQLAQGFKTSPLLANSVRFPIDTALKDFCTEYDFRYTTYGDNLIISGDYIPNNILDFVDELLQSYGFKLKRKKIKFMGRGQRQSILGLTVNEKITVDKNYTKTLIGQTIGLLKNGGEIDAVLMGKINTLSGNTNLRDYKYLRKLVDLTKRNTTHPS